MFSRLCASYSDLRLVLLLFSSISPDALNHDSLLIKSLVGYLHSNADTLYLTLSISVMYLDSGLLDMIYINLCSRDLPTYVVD